MELVNHPKFLGRGTREPVPWPPRHTALRGVGMSRGLPLVGNFYYEPSVDFPDYTTSPALKEHVDFTVGPDRSVAGMWLRLCLLREGWWGRSVRREGWTEKSMWHECASLCVSVPLCVCECADLPITLVCPWGKPVSDYLKPPPPKVPLSC